MSGLREKLECWFKSVGMGRTPFESAVHRAHTILNHLTASGSVVSDEISGPVLQAAAAISGDRVTAEIELAFYTAYPKLTKLAPRNGTTVADEPENSFADALDDAELLLKFAAESGVEIPAEIDRTDSTSLFRLSGRTGLQCCTRGFL